MGESAKETAKAAARRRNVAVCNQLEQYSEQVFDDCLKGAYDPSLTYEINSTIGKAKQKAEDEADSER